jgi:hypothetical protein
MFLVEFPSFDCDFVTMNLNEIDLTSALLRSVNKLEENALISHPQID